MINARAETVHEKPVLPACLRLPPLHPPRRRLLRVGHRARGAGAGGQEGKKKRPRKQPYFVTPADGSVFAMAGLYEFWRDSTLPDDHPPAWWVTCSVITTEAETAPLAVARRRGRTAVAGRHPPPDAADADCRTAGTPGSTRPVRTPEDLRALLAPPPAGADARVPGLHGGQQRPEQRAGAATGAGRAGSGHAVLRASARCSEALEAREAPLP